MGRAIAAFALSVGLAACATAGLAIGTVTLRLDWTARLATVPRRQGRMGRHFDWAHWYPRIAAFKNGRWETQALLPQGEFFGEFGSYDVTLEVADDQVLGATGVPVEGDPGLRRSVRRGRVRVHRVARVLGFRR